MLSVPLKVVHHAVQLGVAAYPEVPETGENLSPVGYATGQILEMIRLSAPVTHPNGNRRHGDWVFRVDDDLVRGVHLIRCDTCQDRKRVDVYDVCGRCDGEGCNWCKQKGEFKNLIPCPECAGKQFDKQ